MKFNHLMVDYTPELSAISDQLSAITGAGVAESFPETARKSLVPRQPIWPRRGPGLIAES
ncbi:MAG: hypothetical protein WBL65_23065 [Bryobacteraceae bacterium]